MNDGFYRAFEDRYRGSRALIASRLEAYLPFVKPLLTVYPAAPALDLGCGRGEWLEVLTHAGFKPLGVDFDAGMLRDCEQLGLQVTKCEAIAYLSALPDNSQALISAFHVVEHISFDDLRALVSQAMRVLMPGGLLIMETPNPENIIVATRNFYLDPTHQRPIPPNLLSFIPEFYGYARVKILRLQEPQDILARPALTLNDVFSGASPDYAVVAQKSGGGILMDELTPCFDKELGVTLEALSSRYDSRIDTMLQHSESLAITAENHARQNGVWLEQSHADHAQAQERHAAHLAEMSQLKQRAENQRDQLEQVRVAHAQVQERNVALQLELRHARAVLQQTYLAESGVREQLQAGRQRAETDAALAQMKVELIAEQRERENARTAKIEGELAMARADFAASQAERLALKVQIEAHIRQLETLNARSVQQDSELSTQKELVAAWRDKHELSSALANERLIRVSALAERLELSDAALDLSQECNQSYATWAAEREKQILSLEAHMLTLENEKTKLQRDFQEATNLLEQKNAEVINLEFERSHLRENLESAMRDALLGIEAERAQGLRVEEELHAHLRHAKAESERLAVDLRAIHQANHQHWLICQQYEKRINALLSSTSWRLSVPVRWAGTTRDKCVKRLQSGVRATSGIARAIKNRLNHSTDPHAQTREKPVPASITISYESVEEVSSVSDMRKNSIVKRLNENLGTTRSDLELGMALRMSRAEAEILEYLQWIRKSSR